MADVADVVAPLAALAAPDTDAVMSLTTTGTPVAVPPKLMLAAPTTLAALMLMSPAAPIPASPALTVPTGAIRFTLPATWPEPVWMVRMPEPATAALNAT